jgi:ATPase subunit of ABC transporter with duplicated ATPase domains
MSRVIAAISRHLGEAVFAVLPVIPYARTEKDGCPGMAVSAKQVTAAARADGPIAFHDATFEIPCGCRTALIGPNGSGKSTQLRVLAGLTPIRSGEILVAGESPRLGRSRIAYLAQRPHLAESFPLKLRRLVQMGTYAHHGWFEECRHGDEAVDRAMARLGLTELAERPVHTLSGGQLQRGLIARAVVQGAEILLLDEPYAALDQPSREIIDRFLFEQGHAFTVVMATHDPADLGRFDRILEMRDGVVTTRHACAGHDHRHA